MKHSSLPPPNKRTRQYPKKLHVFIRDIKWHILSRNGQQYYVPDAMALVQWIYREYLRSRRNYRPVEIFHSIQESWLSESFGDCVECREVFARIITSVFPSEYGYGLKPALKFCGYCQSVKPSSDFGYSYHAKDKKKRFCKICEHMQNVPKPVPKPDPTQTEEEQRADILNKLMHPVDAETLEQLDLDDDPDFSSSRLEELE